jgi:hypothetical protein
MLIICVAIPLLDFAAEWSMMALQHLDLSNNAVSGPLPSPWTNSTSGPLATSLQTLLLNGNQLSGQLSSLLGLPALSCWSVADNWGLCGAAPAAQVCGSTNNTFIGKCQPSHIHHILWQERLPSPHRGC